MFLTEMILYLFSRHRASISLLVIVALFQTNHGLAQELSSRPEFVYSNIFTTEHGLSQNNVSCVTKDLNGLIWVGTGDGLNRFDGYSFIHFSHSDNDSASLSNDGTGISPVVRDRIFDMFYRGSEKSIGNGMGLFMVKKALEILEGSIDIKSEPNVLTTITVRIPLTYPPQA